MVTMFQGTSNGVGSTMVAQSVAEAMAKNTGQRVLLLLFGGITSRIFLKNTEGMKTLNDLVRTVNQELDLNREILTVNDLYAGAIREAGIFIFGGAENRYELDSHIPEIAERLIDIAKQEFDQIIIDGGNTLDYGPASPQVINRKCDLYFTVTSQAMKAINLMDDAIGYANKYGINVDGYIINMYREESVLTDKYIAENANLNGKDLIFIPRVDKAFQCETERRSLLRGKDKAYIRAISTLAETIRKKGEAADNPVGRKSV